MKKLFFALIFSLLSCPAFALLSPFEQSVRELTALIESPDLRDHFPSSEAILDIRKVGTNYIVSTEKRQMTVEIVYMSRNTPGPQEFKLIFSPEKPFGNA